MHWDIRKKKRRERPVCRKELERLMGERGVMLSELAHPPSHLTEGMRIQAEKMELEDREARRKVARKMRKLSKS